MSASEDTKTLEIRHARLEGRPAFAVLYALQLDRCSLFAIFQIIGSLFIGCELSDQAGRAIVRCLRHKEDDSKQENAEENRADPEGPAETEVLNDVSRDKGTTSDTAHQEEIPHGDTSTTLMYVVDILDGSQDKNLIRSHANSRDNTASQERGVALGTRTPAAADKHDNTGQEINRTFTVDLGKGVQQKHTETQCQDEPSSALGKSLDCDVQLRRDFHETR